MGFALSGVFSGIDTDSIIAYEIQAASAPLYRLMDQKDEWETKISATAEIESRVRDLQTLVAKLDDSSTLRQVLAKSSDTDIFDVTATGGATEGSHEIIVNQLATSNKFVHAGVTPTEAWTHVKTVSDANAFFFSDSNITATEYKVVFQFGDDAQVVVNLSAYDATGITLNELITEINTAAGYQAASEVVENGQSSLKIQAQVVGEGKDLVISGDNLIELFDGTNRLTETADGDTGADTIIGAGDFVYTYDGETRTLTLDADSTLGQLRDLINNDSNNPGVTASILEYEVDLTHKFHLILSGDQTGSDYSVTIDAGTDVIGFETVEWEETQTAQDSEFRVDGYPSGPSDWITRSGNTLTDVIDGVTITLQATGTATANLTRSTGQLEEDLGNLVNIYNGIVLKMDEHTGYDETTKQGGVFQGDTVLHSVLRQIRNIFTVSVPGFDGSEGELSLASQIGIEFERDGTMVLHQNSDSSSSTNDDGDLTGYVHIGLSDALKDNFSGVLALIGAIGKGGSDNANVQFNAAGSMTTSGTYEVKVEYDVGDNITDAWFRTKGDTVWRAATFSGNTVTGAEGNPEYLLSVTVTQGSPGSGDPVEAEVRVQKGLAGLLHDLTEAFLDPIDGTFTTKNNEYSFAVEEIDKRIQSQESRLEQKEDWLRAKYARLEARLARLDSQRGAFEAMFQSLSSAQDKAKK